ncbi:MAG: cytochrome c [Bacteroidota bacterium]
MNKLLSVLKWVGIVLGVAIVLFVAAVFALQNKSFDAPYPNITASSDSSVIARGRHLANGPAHCVNCHFAKEDLQKAVNGEPVELKGGFEFALPFGVIRTLNITSDKETGIGNLSDKEIARVLRYGVFPDGRAVFDFMPFHDLSDEDLTAVISYLRTLPPVNHTVVNREINFLGKAVVAFIITPVGPTGEPPKETTIDSTSAYGKYLAHSVANCVGCHTERNMMTGAFVGDPFSGGFKMPSDEKPELTFTTPNLTPDPETGKIFQWTEDVFMHRFRQGVQIAGTPMPWGAFKNMTDLELKAIYRYLQTVEPIHKKIDHVVSKTE